MKAIFKNGGKQYGVNVGDIVYLEKMNGNVDDKVVFDEVLMLGDVIGNPLIKGAKVEGKILKHGKQKKIKIFKYKQKSKSNRLTQGHRQPYTKVEITKIG